MTLKAFQFDSKNTSSLNLIIRLNFSNAVVMAQTLDSHPWKKNRCSPSSLTTVLNRLDPVDLISCRVRRSISGDHRKITLVLQTLSCLGTGPHENQLSLWAEEYVGGSKGFWEIPCCLSGPDMTTTQRALERPRHWRCFYQPALKQSKMK